MTRSELIKKAADLYFEKEQLGYYSGRPAHEATFTAGAQFGIALERERVAGLIEAVRAECYCTDKSTAPSTCDPCLALKKIGEKTTLERLKEGGDEV